MDDRMILHQLRALLDKGCFIRPDREGMCLYVTDFPARFPHLVDKKAASLRENGFCVLPYPGRSALWAVEPDAEAWQVLLDTFARTGTVIPTDQTLPLRSLACLFDRFDTENADMARLLYLACLRKEKDHTRLYGDAAALYAHILRSGGPRPGKGSAGLIRYMLGGTLA